MGSARYLRSYLVFDWPSLHDSGSHQNLFMLAAHYHKLYIPTLQVQQVKENEEMTDFNRLCKSAVGIF